MNMDSLLGDILRTMPNYKRDPYARNGPLAWLILQGAHIRIIEKKMETVVLEQRIYIDYMRIS